MEEAVSIQDAARELILRMDGLRIAMLPEPFDFAKLESFPVQTPRDKPKGFWWGCGPSWLDWVLSDMPSWVHPYAYRIDIDESRLLKLTMPEMIDDFTRTYSKPDNWFIKWQEVIATTGLSGIEISPYQWSRRLTPNNFWYYGWDCASGCVWDKTAIRAVLPFAEYNAIHDRFDFFSGETQKSPDVPPSPEPIVEGKRKVNWKDAT